MSHTPAPWGIPQFGPKEVWAGSDNEGFAGLVAVVETVDGGGITDANARLIAAAPTMADYVQKRAVDGDPEAAQIMEAIRGNA